MFNIDIKILLPLLGVVLGWLLSEVASLLRTRRDERKVIGKAVFKLLQLKEMIFSLWENALTTMEISVADKIPADVKEWVDYLHIDGLDGFESDLNELTSEIATIDPLLAFKIESQLRTACHLLLHSENLMRGSVENKLITKMHSGMAEMTCKHLHNDLNKFILRLMRRKSLYHWFRAWLQFRSERLPSGEAGKILREKASQIEFVYDELHKMEGTK